MTLRGAYRKGTARLEEAGIGDASVDAWQLLEYVTGIGRAAYFADPEQKMDRAHERSYLALIEERAERIPLQHLTGEQEFMGLSFFVDHNVLIPRQDTEILVETALAAVNAADGQALRILDLCTGSGCILLSIMKLAAYPQRISGTGTDISEKALDVARRNAERVGVDAVFLQSDLFEDVEGMFEIIVSNPPYIRTADIPMLQEEVKHDPYLALDGKEDGLYFYRKIVKESRKHLVCGGYLFFEIGCGQAEAVSEMMRRAGFGRIVVKKDLAGLDRVISGVYDEKDE